MIFFSTAVLRGIGQVMLQNHSGAGALMLLGVFYNAPLLGCALLLGTAASTATALLTGADRQDIHNGLHGFNGALVGVALLYFLQPNALTFAYVLLAACATQLLAAALQQWLRGSGLPGLTAPFVLSSWLFVLASQRLARLELSGASPTAALPQAGAVEGVVHWDTLWQGTLNGLGQIFFYKKTQSPAPCFYWPCC